MHRIVAIVAGVWFFVGAVFAAPVPDLEWLESQHPPEIPAEYGEALGYADVPPGQSNGKNLEVASTLLYHSIYGRPSIGRPGELPGKGGY